MGLAWIVEQSLGLQKVTKVTSLADSWLLDGGDGDLDGRLALRSRGVSPAPWATPCGTGYFRYSRVLVVLLWFLRPVPRSSRDP